MVRLAKHGSRASAPRRTEREGECVGPVWRIRSVSASVAGMVMRPIGWDGEEPVSQSPSVGGPQSSDPVNPAFAMVSPSLLEGRLRGNTQVRPRAGLERGLPSWVPAGFGDWAVATRKGCRWTLM
jgi:hypothetical protein